MKLFYAIPAALAIVGLSAFQASAIDVHVGPPAGPEPGGVNVDAPGVGVHVNAAPAAPVVPAAPAGPGVENRGVTNVIGDNRPDQWRYKRENNRWWYYTPDNRWMWYSEPGGWTYYQPSGSYTTGYGGEVVAPSTTYTVPPTTYYYPSTGYYYGYPGYYYGGPGIYIGRGWGWGGYGAYRGGRGWRR